MELWQIGVAIVIGAVVGRFFPPRTASDTPTDPDTVLRQRLDALEQAEALRSAQMVDALDQFDRIFKRIAARQSREDAPRSTNGHPEGSESDLDFRRRVRGG